MPRRNNHKLKPRNHGPSIYNSGFKPGCLGCAFAGKGFVCTTSDGKCLKTKPGSNGNTNAGGTAEGRQPYNAEIK